MKIAAAIVVVFAFALCVSAAASPSCDAQIVWKARSDQYSSWNISATHYQIYDIIVTNQGTCGMSSILALFTAVGASGFVSEGWNYDIKTGIFFGYGGMLQVGQSFYGAGFVLANSSQPNISTTKFTCDSSCSNTTTTSAPTSTPTTIAPTTSTPTTSTPTTSTPTTSTPTTSTPTTKTPTTATPTTATPTTSAPSSCAVTASVARDANWWMDAQGRNTSVYRLTIRNAGPCSLLNIVLSFGIQQGVFVSYWNLVSVQGGYQVTSFGNKLAAGSAWSDAGMILAGAPDNISATPYSSSCAC